MPRRLSERNQFVGGDSRARPSLNRVFWVTAINSLRSAFSRGGIFMIVNRIGTKATGLLLALAAAVCSPLHAQYFGRNKVQYQNFNFQVLKTEHFDIYFYPEERGAATQAARMAERWRTRLGTMFGHELSGRQPLI